jgi:DNA mismatch endonuclease, patch repair protein
MPDVFTKTKRSQVMSRIRGQGNKETEVMLARLLRANRISGWRKQRVVCVAVRSTNFKIAKLGSARASSPLLLRVKADFVFPKLKLAVFVDGCFWHGCPKHCNQPVNNRAFWRKKLGGNKARDLLVTRTLRRAGWRVLRIWEHELARHNQARLVRRIQRSRGEFPR